MKEGGLEIRHKNSGDLKGSHVRCWIGMAGPLGEGLIDPSSTVPRSVCCSTREAVYQYQSRLQSTEVVLIPRHLRATPTWVLRPLR